MREERESTASPEGLTVDARAGPEGAGEGAGPSTSVVPSKVTLTSDKLSGGWEGTC